MVRMTMRVSGDASWTRGIGREAGTAGHVDVEHKD